jgi:hypothetical protein
MNDCLEMLTPLMRHLAKEDDVFAAVTIGVLIGAFLTTRASAEARNCAVEAINSTVAMVDEVQEERRKHLQ